MATIFTYLHSNICLEFNFEVKFKTKIADVVNDMWVGLAIAQDAVDFWLDDFCFFEGELKDELEPPGGKSESTVNPTGKLAVTWSQIKN